jgi:NH3-dependent NAD+ synthetase
MNDLGKELVIDCRHEERRIIEFARQAIARLHKKGAVIGLSGGLDSSLCAYLLEKPWERRRFSPCSCRSGTALRCTVGTPAWSPTAWA